MENEAQLNKVLTLPASSLAALDAIVQYSGTIRQASIEKAQAAATNTGSKLPRFMEVCTCTCTVQYMCVSCAFAEVGDGNMGNTTV